MKVICGCCEPGASPTPLEVDNRPALSAIVYRIGTFSSFREAMLDEIANQPELAGLTTRRSDDYAITHARNVGRGGGRAHLLPGALRERSPSCGRPITAIPSSGSPI